jgi:hypothetical protein
MTLAGNITERCMRGLVLLMAILLFGCSAPYQGSRHHGRIDDFLDHGEESATPLKNMGYAIQVGAFSHLDNAVRFERLLNDCGVDAYYFRHEDGLFKVRFGDHADYRNARSQAETLQRQGVIGNFFIVLPESYASHILKGDQAHLRNELVRTAQRFLGVPYRWGGTDSENGFDCSGLTLVCYRLNGLNLPRVSQNQFQAGRWVPKDRLQKGDLVFFAANGGRQVSHVGMYIGADRFIHAPRTGQTVRIDKLSDPFFTRTYMGGRSYF